MKLYLDDERPIPEGFDVLAKNAKALENIEKIVSNR